MRRDPELVLLLLRYAEEEATGTRFLTEPSFDNYSRSQVGHHIKICQQAGLLEASKQGKVPRIKDLTWKGHEYLDKHRNS